MIQPGPEPDQPRYNVPGLERGLRLLCEFSRNEPVLTGAELARRVEAPRSTVFRLLMTLESMGFVERTEDGRAFRLGLAVLRLGFEYLASLGIAALAQPLIERLRDRSGRSANLVVRDGRDVVYIVRATSSSPFGSSVTVGTRFPAHATALGQLLLGDLNLPEMRTLYPEFRLARYGPKSPETVEALFDRVQRLRTQGWAVSEGGFEVGISAVAAPVLDVHQRVAAVIGVVIPSDRIEPAERKRLIELVCASARELSNLLESPTGAASEAGAQRAAPAGRRSG